MKQVFHKISSLIMAIVVLCSTMSFTIEKHFCGDILVETAIFHKVEGCGMEMEKTSTEGCAITKKNCCKDEQIVIDGQDEMQLSFDKMSLDQQTFMVSFIYSYSTLFESLDEDETTYKDYKPPLVIKEIFKIDEMYLI